MVKWIIWVEIAKCTLLYQLWIMISFYFLIFSRRHSVFSAFLEPTLLSQDICINRLSGNNSFTIKITDFYFHLLISTNRNVIHAKELLNCEGKYQSLSQEISKDAHSEDTTIKRNSKRENTTASLGKFLMAHTGTFLLLSNICCETRITMTMIF